MLPRWQEGSAGPVRAKVGLGQPSGINVVLRALFALQGPAFQLHVITGNTFAQLEIAELVQFPQSKD